MGKNMRDQELDDGAYPQLAAKPKRPWKAPEIILAQLMMRDTDKTNTSNFEHHTAGSIIDENTSNS